MRNIANCPSLQSSDNQPSPMLKSLGSDCSGAYYYLPEVLKSYKHVAWHKLKGISSNYNLVGHILLALTRIPPKLYLE